MKIPMRLVIVLTSGALAAFPAHAQTQDKAAASRMEKKDANYLADLARADMAEVAAGKLASSKAASDDVRKFGQHMVDDHSKMLAEGSKLAKSKGVTPPSAPDKKHQAAAQKLEKLSGAAFDHEYMDQMVKDHQDALKLAQKTASDAKDPELKALADKATPHIEKHLQMAKDLAGKTKSGAASGK